MGAGVEGELFEVEGSGGGHFSFPLSSQWAMRRQSVSLMRCSAREASAARPIVGLSSGVGVTVSRLVVQVSQRHAHHGCSSVSGRSMTGTVTVLEVPVTSGVLQAVRSCPPTVL